MTAIAYRTSDRTKFLRAWLQNPLRIAAVTPSSKSLAQLITSEVDCSTGCVIELGPGTGVFTNVLLERGVLEDNLVLIEQDDDFADILKQRFPTASVLHVDASKIGYYAIADKSFGATISGLPLLSMSHRKVFAILKGSFRQMGQNGRFYQFTYGPRCPIPRRVLDRLGLKAVRIGWTPYNIPPAAVYRVSRRPALI